MAVVQLWGSIDGESLGSVLLLLKLGFCSLHIPMVNQLAEVALFVCMNCALMRLQLVVSLNPFSPLLPSPIICRPR